MNQSPEVTEPPAAVRPPDPEPHGLLVYALACLPAVLVGLGVRIWIMRSPLLPLNADEASTGLQAWGVLHGDFKAIVSGNQYGAATESYLFAPFLAVWTGPVTLRVLSIGLSVIAAVALYALAREFVSRSLALCAALIGWSMSAAVVLVWTRPYMGYTTGFIAEVAAILVATRAMTRPEHLGRLALLGGFAAGFAIYSHPMFGIVSVLALIPPTVIHVRALTGWWLPAAVGGLLGLSPWLVFIARNGPPSGPQLESSYPSRVVGFVVDMMPRLIGLRSGNGTWLGGHAWLVMLIVGLVLAGALVGLILLVRRFRGRALPVLVSGVLAFPALAVVPALVGHADARYGFPFIPPLVVGLAGLGLLLPARGQRSPLLVAVIPTVWALLACVPLIHHDIGWTTADPDAGAEQATAYLLDHGAVAVGGEYWATYLVDYLSDDELKVRPDLWTRFPDDAAAFDQVPVAERFFIYTTGLPPNLPLPADDYDKVTVGGYDIYAPHAG